MKTTQQMFTEAGEITTQQAELFKTLRGDADSEKLLQVFALAVAELSKERDLTATIEREERFLESQKSPQGKLIPQSDYLDKCRAVSGVKAEGEPL